MAHDDAQCPFLGRAFRPENVIDLAGFTVGKACRRRTMTKHLAAAAAAMLLALPAYAADNVRIGFVTTLSGPAGIIGKHMKDSSELALSMLGGKIGGLPAEIVFADDQFKPDVGRQV